MSQGIEQVSGACPHRWAALDVIKNNLKQLALSFVPCASGRNAVGTKGMLVFQSPNGKP
mgnify:CR=1 FL=1